MGFGRNIVQTPHPSATIAEKQVSCIMYSRSKLQIYEAKPGKAGGIH